MQTIDEFDEAWKFLMEKYNLLTHPYMTQLYEIRHKWTKHYFKGDFCEKMTSANHMLKNMCHQASHASVCEEVQEAAIQLGVKMKIMRRGPY